MENCGKWRVPTGHVFQVERARGPSWYAKYRLPDGRQVQKKLGPAWTELGQPLAGYFTRHLAEAWLREVLDKARRGTLPSPPPSATDACRQIARGDCVECGEPAAHKHHVVPKSRGGTFTVPLCLSCHGRTHGSDLIKLMAEGRVRARAKGVVFGAPRSAPSAVHARIMREHVAGVSHAAIARALAFDNVPRLPRNGTQHPSGQWNASTIGQILRRMASREGGCGCGLPHVGRAPRTLPDAVRERIAREHEAGATHEAIAQALAVDGIPNARGGQWYESTVRSLLRRQREALQSNTL
jgi:hypothetical protein